MYLCSAEVLTGGQLFVAGIAAAIPTGGLSIGVSFVGLGFGAHGLIAGAIGTINLKNDIDRLSDRLHFPSSNPGSSGGKKPTSINQLQKKVEKGQAPRTIKQFERDRVGPNKEHYSVPHS